MAENSLEIAGVGTDSEEDSSDDSDDDDSESDSDGDVFPGFSQASRGLFVAKKQESKGELSDGWSGGNDPWSMGRKSSAASSPEEFMKKYAHAGSGSSSSGVALSMEEFNKRYGNGKVDLKMPDSWKSPAETKSEDAQVTPETRKKTQAKPKGHRVGTPPGLETPTRTTSPTDPLGSSRSHNRLPGTDETAGSRNPVTDDSTARLQTPDSSGSSGNGFQAVEKKNETGMPDKDFRKLQKYIEEIESRIRRAWARGNAMEVTMKEIPRRPARRVEESIDMVAVKKKVKKKDEVKLNDDELGAAGMVGSGDWVKIKNGITLDSGSCVDIGPGKYLPQFPVEKDESGQKKNYVAANGSPIKYFGEKTIKFWTDEGMKCKWKFTAAEVNKMLKSVSKTSDDGCYLLFTNVGGHIIDVTDRDVKAEIDRLVAAIEGTIKFNRVGDTYKLDAWVKRPAQKNSQDFPRQGK